MVKRPDRENQRSTEKQEKEKGKRDRRKRVRTSKGLYKDRMLRSSENRGFEQIAS